MICDRPDGYAASAELQGAFVTDEQQRLLEIEEMRLVVKFGEKKRGSGVVIRQIQASGATSLRAPVGHHELSTVS